MCQMLFSQVVPTTSEGVGAWVGMISGMGFAVWYAWHTTTTTIPGMLTQFRDELKQQRESHQKVVNAQREDYQRNLETFWVELRAENKARHQDTQELAAAIRGLNIDKGSA